MHWKPDQGANFQPALVWEKKSFAGAIQSWRIYMVNGVIPAVSAPK